MSHTDIWFVALDEYLRVIKKQNRTEAYRRIRKADSYEQNTRSKTEENENQQKHQIEETLYNLQANWSHFESFTGNW